jgi:uncharacterized membrane protein (DUF373 family)
MNTATGTRGILARVFTWVEDVVYIGLGVLLAVSALVLLGHTALAFSRDLMHAALPGAIVSLLDRLLLVLVIVELLYTIQVSFREHALVPEPFLIVGLVAATRRVLVLTAEFTGGQPAPEAAFRVAMIELGVLTAMIVALVGSLLMLRRRHPGATATRA